MPVFADTPGRSMLPARPAWSTGAPRGRFDLAASPASCSTRPTCSMTTRCGAAACGRWPRGWACGPSMPAGSSPGTSGTCRPSIADAVSRSRHCTAFLLSAGLSWAQIDEIAADSLLDRRRSARVATATGRRGHDRPACRAGHSAGRLGRFGRAGTAPGRAARPPGAWRGAFGPASTSFDLEAAQPDPALLSGQRSNVLPAAAGDTLYVGHDPRHLAGARRAGLVTVAFNHAAGASADHRLDPVCRAGGHRRRSALPAPPE